MNKFVIIIIIIYLLYYTLYYYYLFSENTTVGLKGRRTCSYVGPYNTVEMKR